MTKFVIRGKLDGLNNVINASRTNQYKANNMKRKAHTVVIQAIREAKLPKVTKYPIKLKTVWYEPNKRRDADNVVAGGRKAILDAMVEIGIIEDDGIKFVDSFEDEVRCDRENPRIEIEILERGD